MNHLNPVIRAWTLSIATAATLFSNPIPVPEYPPITEIQVTNPNKWTIEVDLDNIDFHQPNASYSTDTITLACIESSLTPSDLSMKKCVLPETVNDDNIMVLTEQHFPGLQIDQGKTLYVSLRGQNRKWSVPITQNLFLPGMSLKFMYTNDQQYVLSSCPSPGIKNYREPKGQIRGTVRDRKGTLVSGIYVLCSPNPTQNLTPGRNITNADGFFATTTLDTCHTYSLTFLNDSGIQISDSVIGPFTVTSGTPIRRDIVLGDYTIPPVNVLHPDGSAKSTVLVQLLPSDMSVRKIVVAVSGLQHSQEAKLDIYSMNGHHIRSLSFTCAGSGTYTIPWDGCNKKNRQVTGGSYICRVRIGNKVLCKGIITN